MCPNFCLNICFHSLGSVLRSRIAGSYDKSVFSILRKYQTVCQSGWTIWHSHQQWMRVLVLPHPYQHLLLSVLNFSHPSVKCYLTVILICISLMTNWCWASFHVFPLSLYLPTSYMFLERLQCAKHEGRISCSQWLYSLVKETKKWPNESPGSRGLEVQKLWWHTGSKNDGYVTQRNREDLDRQRMKWFPLF